MYEFELCVFCLFLFLQLNSEKKIGYLYKQKKQKKDKHKVCWLRCRFRVGWARNNLFYVLANLVSWRL